MLLANAAGQHTTTIARTLHCNEQTVRNAIHTFDARGLAALQPGSSRPLTAAPIFDAARRDQLRALLHQSPRAFGKPTGVWTLALAAEVCYAEGFTPRRVSLETIRMPSTRWACPGSGPSTGSPAPTRPTSGKKTARPPDPPGSEPSQVGARLCRRVWWSRLAQPDLHALGWPTTPGCGLQELAVCQGRPRPQGAGLLRPAACGGRARRTRCCCASSTGRRSAQVTTDFLAWVQRAAGRAGQEGPAAGLGQRLLAHQPAGAGLDQGAQSAGEA